jgi:peptidase S24-like protein
MEVTAIREAEVLYLEVALPGRPVQTAGVLLFDPENDRLYYRLRRDWNEIAEDEEDVEVLSALAEDFQRKIDEMGGRAFLELIEDSLSLVLRVSERERTQVGDFEARLNRLYRQHVQATVQRFVTHLPQYSLRAAAGKFGGDDDIEPEGWIEAPPGMKLYPDMFVAHITGGSMSDVIPDGSLCVFRANTAGTRQGKIVLVERLGETYGAGEVTIKNYKSSKIPGERDWEHESITMHPRSDQSDWDLNESDRLRVIAEWVRTLPPEES